MLEKIFKLKENNTSVKTELIAGFTTFITMAYIIFVNPQLMSSAGMDQGASFVGTCLAAAIACILMGLYANWPIGLAPGMGLNAFFTYTVVGEMGYTWEIALGAVFIAGILFWIMSITQIRQWMSYCHHLVYRRYVVQSFAATLVAQIAICLQRSRAYRAMIKRPRIHGAFCLALLFLISNA